MKKALALLLLLSSATIKAAKHPTGPPLKSDFSAADYEKLKAKIGDRHIYLHLIAHTHDDVGWIKTVDEYYSGTQNKQAHASVKLILDTVIDELVEDPNKKFTYVEMKFFELWWNEQTEDRKNTVRQLTQEGRLEFINAGWSMQDEACPHYEDMINNMRYGNEFLNREVGFRPTIGWHVDPFGHSSANPRLMAEMGFDAWFFARGDHVDRDERRANKSMEFIWQPMYSHLGNTTQIFTHFQYDHYCWSDGFWYDDRWYGDNAVVVNPDLETFNADRKVNQLLDRINSLLDSYYGDHLFLTWGCDFTFANARMNFLSMDRIINYFNSHVENITIMYSTPGYYLKEVKAQNLTYPVNYYDMFPYSNGDNDFWTGFFSSRPNSKRQVRDGQANLHASNKIFALRALDQHTTDEEISEIIIAANNLQDAQGVNQHHDGITGTARQHVADDYNWRIYKAMNESNAVYAQVMEELISYYSNIQSSEWLWCERMNGTYLDCPIANNLNKDHIVVVHNPTLYDQSYVRMKVSHGNYTIQQWDNEKLVFNTITTAAVICVDREVENNDTVHDCDLHIKSTFGASAFTILQLTYNTSADLTIKESATGKHTIASSNETLNYTGTDEKYGVKFDLIKTYSTKTYSIAFNMEFYFSYDVDDDQKSGAYDFRPMTANATDGSYGNLTTIKSFNSDFVNEIFMQFSNENGTQKVDVKLRYYDQSLTSEWEVYIHAIPQDPVSDPEKFSPPGREVIVVWRSFDIENNKTFYTDSNGLEMQQRILNYKPQYTYQGGQPIAGNYYPINSAISIIDETKKLQMTVMNDRSQGGTSVEEGKIELMQHRRIFGDDGKGVDENLEEPGPYGNGISAPATYRLEFLERDMTLSYQRNVQLLMDEPMQLFFSFNYTTKQDSLLTPLQTPKLALNDATIPAAVKYLLFPLEKNKIHIRLENIGDRFDTDHWNLTANSSVVVPLGLLCQKLFDEANHKNTSIKLTNITYVETSLNGVYEISEMRNSKTKWNVNTTTTQPIPAPPVNYPSQDVKQDYNNIVLEQQRIRSFNVTFEVQTISQASLEKVQFLY